MKPPDKFSKRRFEGGVYSLDEAKKRIAEHQTVIAKAEQEIERLEEIQTSQPAGVDIDAMKAQLKALRDENLDQATFEDKLDIICKLGIKVCPAEDLKSMRVLCQLNLEQMQSDKQSSKLNFIESHT